MLMAMSTPLSVFGLVSQCERERGRFGNQLALMAPYWGFFVAFTLHLQERC